MASSVLFLIPLKLERGRKFKIDRKVGEVMSGIGKGEWHGRDRWKRVGRVGMRGRDKGEG